jgi:hypothetical protein
MTVLSRLLDALKSSADFNRNDVVPPSVILWTDGDRCWENVAKLIAESRPGFFALDPSHTTELTGTAAWIRYQLDRFQGQEQTPVVYLPGVARHQFRGVAAFPDVARHLYALQFVGQFFTQANSKDWTPLAFLSSTHGGLGLDVARDAATQEALQSQLAAVLRTPLASLQRGRLQAGDFHDLAVSDPVQSVLQWMSDPAAIDSWSAEQQAAFRSIMTAEFSVDPAKDGVLVAAEKLVTGSGKWEQVWTRFQEAPDAYRGVVRSLEGVQPEDLFSNTNLRIPAVNKKLEDDLRANLRELASLHAAEARKGIGVLADFHAARADSPWAKTGEAKLAVAVQHLRRMVDAIERGLGGTTCDELAASYLEHGWIVDSEARKAYAAVTRSEDADAVSQILRNIYFSWMEDAALRLQQASATYPVQNAEQAFAVAPEPGTVVLFVDGLRADVARELSGHLERSRFEIDEIVRWVPLPTVTANAKPGWKPLTSSLTGEDPGETFEPRLSGSGAPCRTKEFRDLLSEHGWTWVEPTTTGDPSTAGWAEIGSLDKQGHSLGAKLVHHVGSEVRAIVERIEGLLEAGWNKVHLVTDHGWLWMPGGLNKVELPKHLTETRWSRCARPASQARHALPQVAWFWGNEHAIVLPGGIGAFREKIEYAHGGLTLQEALTVSLVLTPVRAARQVAIFSVRWAGLRMIVEAPGADESVTADLRSKAADAGSSFLSEEQRGKAFKDGSIALLVEDDSYQGSAAVLVLLKDGQVLAKKNITIGEE